MLCIRETAKVFHLNYSCEHVVVSHELLICISLLINVAEHLFVRSFAIWVSFSVKGLCKSFTHFYWNVLDTRLLSAMRFTNIFFQSVIYLFISLTVSCEEQKFLILMKPNLLMFL